MAQLAIRARIRLPRARERRSVFAWTFNAALGLITRFVGLCAIVGSVRVMTETLGDIRLALVVFGLGVWGLYRFIERDAEEDRQRHERELAVYRAALAEYEAAEGDEITD